MMFTSKFSLLCACWLLLVGVLACSPAAAPAPTTKLRVVATTTQVAALAKVAGGDAIALTGLLKANTDPHEYEPQPDDVRALANAQVIFKNGVGLEKWLDKLIENSGTKAPVIDSSKGVQVRKGDEESPGGDPHIWHNPLNAIIMLNNIRDGLSQRDPANAQRYSANAAAYAQKLSELDQYIAAQVASVPPAQRKLVSNHDTFGYYVDRYGLTFVGSIIPSRSRAAACCP